MSGKRHPEEFKIEAVKQLTERGHPATEVAARLGVSSHSLYHWVKRASQSEPLWCILIRAASSAVTIGAIF
jgi:transposase-like protein